MVHALCPCITPSHYHLFQAASMRALFVLRTGSLQRLPRIFASLEQKQRKEGLKGLEVNFPKFYSVEEV